MILAVESHPVCSSSQGALLVCEAAESDASAIVVVSSEPSSLTGQEDDGRRC